MRWRDNPVPKRTEKGKDIAEKLKDLKQKMLLNSNKFSDADGKELSTTIKEAKVFFQDRIDMYTKSFFSKPEVKQQASTSRRRPGRR